MRLKTILWLAAALVLLMSACERMVDVPVPDAPDAEGEIELEEYAFESVDVEEVGSITLNVMNLLDDGVSTINCDTNHTIWLQFDQKNPETVSKNLKDNDEVECEVELVRTGVIGSASTTATMPVTYTFNVEFAPYPKCELTVQVDTVFAYSQVKVLHDSALGDLALPDGLGDDLLTSFPVHVFKTSGEPFSIIEGLVTWSITPNDYVIPTWTRCIYP